MLYTPCALRPFGYSLARGIFDEVVAGATKCLSGIPKEICGKRLGPVVKEKAIEGTNSKGPRLQYIK